MTLYCLEKINRGDLLKSYFNKFCKKIKNGKDKYDCIATDESNNYKIEVALFN